MFLWLGWVHYIVITLLSALKVCIRASKQDLAWQYGWMDSLGPVTAATSTTAAGYHLLAKAAAGRKQEWVQGSLKNTSLEVVVAAQVLTSVVTGHVTEQRELSPHTGAAAHLLAWGSCSLTPALGLPLPPNLPPAWMTTETILIPTYFVLNSL